MKFEKKIIASIIIYYHYNVLLRYLIPGRKAFCFMFSYKMFSFNSDSVLEYLISFDREDQKGSFCDGYFPYHVSQTKLWLLQTIITS